MERWSFLTKPRPSPAVHRPRPGRPAARHRRQPGHHRPQRLRHRHRPDHSRVCRQAQGRPRQPLPDPGAPPAARARQSGTRHRRSPGPANRTTAPGISPARPRPPDATATSGAGRHLRRTCRSPAAGIRPASPQASPGTQKIRVGISTWARYNSPRTRSGAERPSSALTGRTPSGQ